MTPQLRLESESADELFDCLSHARRRQLIEIVRAESTPIATDTILDTIIVQSGTSNGPKSNGLSDDIAVSLFHRHLPKLREGGIIDIDTDLDLVREGDQFTRAVKHLEMV